MKPAPANVSKQKTVKVIRNAHTAVEQQAIGDRWADGPRMTLAEAMAHAARLEEEKQKQPAE